MINDIPGPGEEQLPLKGGHGGGAEQQKIGRGLPTPEEGMFDSPFSNDTSHQNISEQKEDPADDRWASVVRAGIKKSLIEPAAPDVSDGRKITAETAVRFVKQNAQLESAKESEEQEFTRIGSLDLKVEENALLHHTDRFFAVKKKKENQLVVRRGQEFRISISFAEDFQLQSSKVQIVFELCSNSQQLPCESQCSLAMFPWELNKETVNCNGWWLQLVRTGDDNTVDMCVKCPAHAQIGRWTLKLRTQSTDSFAQATKKTLSVAEFFLLFNPWIKEDPVFLENQEDIEEYVLQDIGPIWKGTQQSMQKVEWVFGQFEQDVLENSIFLLENSGLALPLRCSPVLLCRTIAQCINSKNSPGVLTGNFTNLFSRGSHPSSFTGSAPILNEFACYGRPVRYAQCWVFSGLMCTVMRCFGIPCRVVTNYNSVHDLVGTNVNIHFSKETGNILRNYGSDMTWNFHVWNECWMSRPDLPEGYSGWQAVSATPQKKFEDVSKAGPAPVCAILSGQSNFAFDTDLFRSEITALKRYWVIDDVKNESNLVGTEKSTGTQLVTKAKGENGLSDITFHYKQQNTVTLLVPAKPTEGKVGKKKIVEGFTSCCRGILNRFRPPTERLSAVPQSSETTEEHNAQTNERTTPSSAEISGTTEASLDLSESSVLIGQDILLGLNLTNHAREERTLDIKLRVGSCLYTGAPGQNVLTAQQALALQATEEKFLSYTIKQADYVEKMLDQGFFHVKMFAMVKETGEMLAKTAAFCLKMPEIKMEIENLDKAKCAKLKFRNPTALQLKECRFIIEGAGLTGVKSIALNDIGPGSETEATLDIFPWRTGTLTLVARFSSDKIVDVHGSCTVDVS